MQNALHLKRRHYSSWDISTEPASARRIGLGFSVAITVEQGGAEDPEALPEDPLTALKTFGDFDNLVVARAHVVSGIMAMRDEDPERRASLDLFDRALVLLKGENPIHRTPIFTLRLHTMELADADMDTIRAWLDGYQAIWLNIMDSIFTLVKPRDNRHPFYWLPS